MVEEVDKTDKEIVTYIFGSNVHDVTAVTTVSTARKWQIISCISASLMCVPFGLMLGWPSPVYPVLLQSASPVPITIDQSAMVAGFLMVGNVAGTPFSTKTFFCSKYGIMLSTGLMACGWFIMWQASSIYWLLGSRFLIGFANGYGVGQLKAYIREICDDGMPVLLIKQINLYILFGIIVMFSFGPFVDFRDISIIALIINICILFITIFLPSATREQIKVNKIEIISKVFSSHISVNNDMNKVPQDINKSAPTVSGFRRIIKNNILRRHFNIFWFLVFCQQFSGAPATIIYTQILFEKSHSSHPVYFAILYVIVFFFANVLGIFVTPKCDKKSVLLFSSFTGSVAIVIKICVIYFKINETYWSYSSITIMLFFITVHTIGLGNIPFTLIPNLFPKDCQDFVTRFFIMFHCMLALIITKIFQVLMDRFNLCVPFYLFLSVSAISFIFVLVCFPKTKNLQDLTYS